MNFTDLVLKNRSYRRFDASVPISEDTLISLIQLARITPSSSNRQPLKYVLSCTGAWNAKIFGCLSWAGSLPEWPGPGEAERPTGYIVILTDSEISGLTPTDVGIVAQTMLLGAVEMGLGGCMLGSVKRKELAEILGLPENFHISLVVALGKPVEKVKLVDAEPQGSVKYYRDDAQTHYVPKRKLDELIERVYS